MRSLLIISLMSVLSCVAGTAASSQNYPERPVTIIVPVGPGAGPDVIARILADQLSKHWKQQVLIVNRPGGSGIIGAQAAIQAAADGYTLYMPLSSAFAVLPESKTKLPVDLDKDFATIGLIGEQPMTYAVTPKLGAVQGRPAPSGRRRGFEQEVHNQEPQGGVRADRERIRPTACGFVRGRLS